MFAYVFYGSVVRQHLVTLGELVKNASSLSLDDQLLLLFDLKKRLEGAGVL